MKGTVVMKKILTIAVVLVMSITLMVGASANAYAGTDAIDNMRDLVAELAEAVGGVDILGAMVNDFLVNAGLSVGDEFPEGTDEALFNTITLHLIDNGHAVDGRLVTSLSNMMSNDFIDFLARLYIPCWFGHGSLGDSHTIAIAAGAVIALTGAGAFVLLKNKQEK